MCANMSSAAMEAKTDGRLNFKVLENTPSVYVIRDGKTRVSLESKVQRVSWSGGRGRIFYTDSVITCPEANARPGDTLRERQDLEFDTVQEGKVVCKIENGVTVHIVPIIMRIDRAGACLPDGGERHDVISVTKIKAMPAPE